MKRWTLRKHDAEAVNRLAAELGVKPLVAALLISRGHENKVVSEGKTKQNTSGRIRSVYKVKPQ